jgi:microcystin-dependent protein
MAVQAMWLQNVDYPARWDRTVFDNLWENEGIIGAASFAVTQRSTPSMAVDVAAGVAVVTGDDQAFQGKYLCREEAVTANVTIAAAPGSGTRHDLVVLKVRDPNAGGAAGDDAVIQVVAGTPSGSPVDPAVPASALVLARVRVPSGTGTITNALIDNLRVRVRVTGATVPVGSVMPYAGTVAPDGWLMCNGSSTAGFPALAALVGANTPDLRGRFPLGKTASGTGSTLLGTGGSTTIATGNLPSHNHSINHDHPNVTSTGMSANATLGHTITDPGHAHNTNSDSYLFQYQAGVNQSADGVTFPGRLSTTNTTGISIANHNVAHTHDVDVPNFTGTSGSTGSGTAYFQPFLALNFIIKT